MNQIDVNSLIEKAKQNAKAAGIPAAEVSQASQVPEGDKEAMSIEDLMRRIEDQVELEQLGEELEKKAAAERSRHLMMAKLLAAVDTFAEVGR